MTVIKPVVVLIAVMMVCLAAGCSPRPESTISPSTATSADAAGDKTFAIVFPMVHTSFDPMVHDAEVYAEASGWQVIVDAPEASDILGQQAIMEELIKRPVDGIAIGPADPATMTAYINRAIDQGIPVICLGTDAPDSRRLAYIGIDNYQAGRSMGDVIGRSLAGEGKVLLLSGISGQLSLLERIQGVKDYLAENHPDIVIADEQNNEGDPQMAIEMTEAMIKKHPDFNALVCVETIGGSAAVAVWKAKGWQNDPEKIILAYNDTPGNLQGLRDGFIKTIVAQLRSSWAQLALDTLNDLSEGRPVAPVTDTGTVEITLKNIDNYLDGQSD